MRGRQNGNKLALASIPICACLTILFENMYHRPRQIKHSYVSAHHGFGECDVLLSNGNEGETDLYRWFRNSRFVAVCICPLVAKGKKNAQRRKAWTTLPTDLSVVKCPWKETSVLAESVTSLLGRSVEPDHKPNKSQDSPGLRKSHTWNTFDTEKPPLTAADIYFA
jgi:hypothetical protein